MDPASEPTTQNIRQRIPTEAGKQHQKELKMKAFKRQYKEVLKLTEDTVGSQDEINPDAGQEQLEKWTHAYVSLIQILSDLRALVSPDEFTTLEKDTERFHNLNRSIQEALGKITKAALRAPSVAASRSSRMSSASVRASLKILQMQSEHQNAALRAKQAVVQRRRELEKEKQALKWKEEDLELEVEATIAEEQMKTLHKFELEVDDDVRLHTDEAVMAATERPKLNFDAPCFYPVDAGTTVKQQQQPEDDARIGHYPTQEIDSRTAHVSELLAEQRRSQLPALEPEVFHGEVARFHPWMRAFECFIERRTASPSERLHFLSRYTSGEARTVIEGFFLLSTSDAYDQAKKKLNERYGNDFIIANSYRKKLREWPAIRPGDSKGLRQFADFLDSCLAAASQVAGLTSLNEAHENHMMLQKLPRYVVDRWKRVVDSRVHDPQEGMAPGYPTFHEFVCFLNKEARVACAPVDDKTVEPPAARTPSTGQGSRVNARAFVSSASTGGAAKFSHTCKLCFKPHAIEDCSTFKNMTLSERQDVTRRLGMCRGCLRRGHVVKECKRRQRCQECGGLHPTLLHDNTFVPMANPPSRYAHKETQATSLKVSTGEPDGNACSHSMIVPVILRQDNDGEGLVVYALLDPQSDACFVTDSTLAKLRIKGECVNLQLSTMAGKTTVKSTRVTGLSVQGLRSTQHIQLPPTYSRSEIPADKDMIPRRDMLERWEHLKGVAKDLPPYLPDAEIGLLLGTNCPRAVRPIEIISATGEDPWSIRTELGWSVVGVVHDLPRTSSTHCHFAFKTHAREVSPMELSRMFEADFTEESTERTVSQEDCQFLNIMNNDFYQRPDKHFEGPLPLKDQNVSFPNNKNMALKRLWSLKKKFAHDISFREEYSKSITESLKRGYAERIPDNELSTQNGKIWFVPHHGVRHAKKGKLRVVYDCSAEYKGFSLNSQLLQGPDYIKNLAGIFTRFRKEKIAFSCDIEGMFNQVFVSKRDRDLLRFLWWDNNETDTQPMQYRMTTHLFGAVSSPACAMYALHATAEKYEEEFGTEAANFVRNNFYVDDGLISMPDTNSAVRLAQDTINLCAKGGFRLHKFVSNDQSFIEKLPPESAPKNATSMEVRLHHPTYERALGVKWNTETDTLHIDINIPERPVTRRGILGTVSSLYDPIGLISPVILKGKHIVKLLCCDGYSWDEPVPENIAASWIQWRDDVPKLSDIAVPRCYKSTSNQVRVHELHHFSDASTLGLGQVSYLRTIDEQGMISSSLVFSKAKVTPKGAITIPRLELAAAVLSVMAGRFLEKELDISKVEHFYWTDSKVVLGYINNESRRFHVFVANRVQRIRQNSHPKQWNFVPSKENPADLASRGLTADELRESTLWWYGPQFLTSSETLPEATEAVEVPDSDPEVKNIRVLATSCQKEHEKIHASISTRLTSFSSWYRAKKAVAICIRYQQILLRRIRGGEPTQKNQVLTEVPIFTEELVTAEKMIIKSVQSSEFKKQIDSLSIQKSSTERRSVTKQSDIYRLDPYIDQEGLLRVGGRTRRSGQPLEVVHPVIVPKNHHVTRILIAHFHEKTKHSGRGITLTEIRTSGFWIVRGRSAVAQWLRRCARCIRLRGSPCVQKMADLPTERVEPAEPFTFSGCDCFGPFFIKERRSEVKRWGIVFTCLSSRAVHIETLNSMTADSFINAYRRFVSRRGPIRKLMCDNGTNFIGGKSYLEASLDEMDRDKIRKTLLSDSCDYIEMEHITPRASHMGGSWERQIRTLRSVLNRLLQETGLQIDDELLRTIMTEAEAVVNSRPLTYVDMTDSDSVAPITPSQLLTLKHKLVLPLPGKFERSDVYAKQRWRRVQYLANQFWIRWRREFLPTLQERRKWVRTEANLEPGEVVIVIDEATPRCQWPLGRIVAVYPSDDALVRSVRVRIGHTEYDRPIHKLIRLVR